VRGVSVAALEAGERDARHSDAAKAMRGDSFVNDLVTMFDGRVVDGSVQPARKDG
jgi:hypothetical protein